MIYALKLLFVVMLVCGFATIAFRSAFRGVLSAEAYRQAWKLVVLTTVAAFLCKFPVLFLLALSLIAIYGNSQIGNKAVGAISVYLLLAVIAPSISFDLGGVGGINYLLRLDHFRVTALVLLVPMALRLVSTKRGVGYGSLLLFDVTIVGYQLFRIALSLPYSSTTILARGLVETILDILLPYYVVTRSIRNLADLRFVVAHMAIGLIFGACVAVAECITQHNLYSGLQGIYGIKWQLTYELMRGSLIRVQAMTQQPIILAVAMVFGLGIWIWLRGFEWRRARFFLAFMMLLVALVGTWSRGPWLACGVLLFMFFILHKLSSGAAKLLLIMIVFGAIMAKVLGADAAVVSALAALFGGSGEDLSSIDYRRQLLDTSLALIKQSPWFGVSNYAAQMQDLKQGEGIVDIVNNYVAVMLNAGLVGLAFYLAPFVIVIHRMLNAIRRDETGAVSQSSRFAIAMVAMNVACLFAIFTTSTFGILPLLMTLLVALPSAWLAMPMQERDADLPPASDEDLEKERLARYGAIQSFAP